MYGWSVWCDGACDPNPGRGGWAFVATDHKEKKRIVRTGFQSFTTNNRMEYIAALEGIRSTPLGSDLTVFSDSQLLIFTVTKWAEGWIKREILHKKKNTDLVLELLKECSLRKVSWKWVKGHSGIVENDEVDLLAQRAARMQKEINIDIGRNYFNI